LNPYATGQGDRRRWLSHLCWSVLPSSSSPASPSSSFSAASRPEHQPTTHRRTAGRLVAAWKPSHTLTGLAEQRGPTERDEHFQKMEAQPPPSTRQETPQHEDDRRVADAQEDTRREDDDQDRRLGSRVGHSFLLLQLLSKFLFDAIHRRFVRHRKRVASSMGYSLKSGLKLHSTKVGNAQRIGGRTSHVVVARRQ
jgi:hypothetical protein